MVWNRRRVIGVTAGAAVVTASGLGWYANSYLSRGPGQSASLLVAGASTMLKLNRALAKAYSAHHPNIDIVVDQGGSLSGLIALKRGAIDIAAMSRDLSSSEDDWSTQSRLVAKNEIAFAVHPDSPLRNITRAQLKAIYSGEVSRWSQVGGPDAPIHIFSRKKPSTSRKFVEEIVLGGLDIRLDAIELESAKIMAEKIREDHLAVGFIALKDRTESPGQPLRYLEVDGVKPERITVLSGRYPFTQPLYLVLHGRATEPARRFVDFALAPEGQRIVVAQSLVAVA